MKAIRRRTMGIFLLGVLLFLCTGCTSQKAEPEGYRVVTQIDVYYHKDPLVAEGTFTAPEKMQKILYYLRRISPYGTPKDDPEQVQGSDFYITLSYSDQTKKTYQQRDDRFMRINDGPWKRIDPKRAPMLRQILSTISSDTDNKSGTPFLMQACSPRADNIRPYDKIEKYCKKKADAFASAFFSGAGDEARSHFVLRQNNCCDQFLNWSPQQSTGLLHLNLRASSAFSQKRKADAFASAFLFWSG